MDLGREHDFRVLAAVRGDVGLQMARQHRPDAITLDLDLPGLDGWNVLDRLKHDPSTRHIPVHVISVTDDPHRGMRLGAKTLSGQAVGAASRWTRRFDAIREFIDRKLQDAADRRGRRRAAQHARRADRRSATSRSPRSAPARKRWTQLEQQPFDCIVLDLGLNDMSGLRAARADAGRQVAVAGAGDRLHRQGADARPRKPSCGGWRRPSSSRTSSRPSACSTRRRCSCTASRARCRPRSSGCSISCTAATRRSPARRRWSWTTTSATSSR